MAQGNSSPQRFTPRAGSRMPGAVRRALDGQIDSNRRYGQTLEVAQDGRLEVKAAPGGGLKMTRQGLVIDQAQVGEKNRPPVSMIKEPLEGASSTEKLDNLRAAFIDLLAELKRTGRMR